MAALSRAAAERAARMLGLLAAPSRLLILQAIQARGGMTVGAIAEKLSMSQSAVSHQLRLLADAKIAAAKKEGREVTYEIARTAAAREAARLLRSVL